jgi:hypothetical protein
MDLCVKSVKLSDLSEGNVFGQTWRSAVFYSMLIVLDPHVRDHTHLPGF